jgi:hypothetical protein
MKKILFIALALFTFSINLSAQTASAAEDTEHKEESSKGEKMKALLGLSDDQTAQFREVVTARREAIAAVKADAALSADAKDTKIKAINDERETKLKKIFTPEQFAKWAEYKKNK